MADQNAEERALVIEERHFKGNPHFRGDIAHAIRAAERAAYERAAVVAEKHGSVVSNEPVGKACSRNIARAIRKLADG